MPNRADHIPLDTLRVFESAARQLSFTSAAIELGSSQPAISQQIKRLEQLLAVRLFDRVYRGIALTEAGTQLLGYVQQGLDTLDSGIAAICEQPQHEVLQVGTDFAFASYWLMPRLERFNRLYPEVDVSLVTSDRGLGALTPDTDVAIVFGDGRFKQGETHLLFREEVFPVCSPLLLTGQASPLPPAGLARMPLLDLRPENRSRWFDWNGLFQALDIAEAPSPGMLRFDNYTLLIQAAIAAQGVAIGWRHLVDDLVLQGLLCRVCEESACSEYGYYIVVPPRKRRQRLINRFVTWLQSERE